VILSSEISALRGPYFTYTRKRIYARNFHFYYALWVEFTIKYVHLFFLRFLRSAQASTCVYVYNMRRRTDIDIRTVEIYDMRKKKRLGYVYMVGHGLHQFLSYSFLMTAIRIYFSFVSESI
jgi:hypothetical protein